MFIIIIPCYSYIYAIHVYNSNSGLVGLWLSVIKGVARNTVFAHSIPHYIHVKCSMFIIMWVEIFPFNRWTPQRNVFGFILLTTRIRLFECSIYHFHLNSAKLWFYDFRRRRFFFSSCFALHSGVIFVYGYFELHETWTFSIYTKWLNRNRE